MSLVPFPLLGKDWQIRVQTITGLRERPWPRRHRPQYGRSPEDTTCHAPPYRPSGRLVACAVAAPPALPPAHKYLLLRPLISLSPLVLLLGRTKHLWVR